MVVRFNHSLDDLFQRSLGRSSGWKASSVRNFPALNVWDDNDHLFVEAEISGVRMEDLDLSIFEDELTIKGQRTLKDEQGTVYHRRERGTGSFSRMLKLPFEIDDEHVDAELSAGVLLLKLPKAVAAKPRKIEVKLCT